MQTNHLGWERVKSFWLEIQHRRHVRDWEEWLLQAHAVHPKTGHISWIKVIVENRLIVLHTERVQSAWGNNWSVCRCGLFMIFCHCFTVLKPPFLIDSSVVRHDLQCRAPYCFYKTVLHNANIKNHSVYEVKVEQTCPRHVMKTTLGTIIEILEWNNALNKPALLTAYTT